MATNNEILRHLSVRSALRIAEPWAARYVEPAFHGDFQAAFSLAGALSNARREDVAILMWQAKVDREAFRTFLGMVWEHDHHHIINAAGTRRRLAAMFRYAAFPIPTTIGDTVRVWRGTCALTLAQARTGYSWTLDRDVACWFAMRFTRNGRALVLVAEVLRDAISYHTNERAESEVVLFKAPA
jgi:hypothetical protein